MSMRAIYLTGYGTTDRLELRTVPRPSPGPTEVLLRVRACGINDWDWGTVTGKSALTRLGEGLFSPRRHLLGLDVAGEVEAVGVDVRDFAVGDRVFGDVSGAGFGGFAEYATPAETALTAMPDDLSFVDAAALAHAGALAAQALDRAGLQPGQSLLINGAGGGVGSLAVQLATNLGVTDITGVDSAAKRDFLLDLGFARALDYREVDFTNMGEQFDVIIDARSTRAPADYARALAEGGHYVTVGGETRRILAVALSKARILKKTGKTVALLAFRANKDNARLLDLVAAGALTPRIDSTWPLEQTPEAMARFGRGEHCGKIVITID